MNALFKQEAKLFLASCLMAFIGWRGARISSACAVAMMSRRTLFGT